MPDFGTGYGTPIGTSGPIGLASREPIPYTHLALHRYAKILGIAPLHFAGAATPELSPVIFPYDSCNQPWFKYNWQDSDKVSWMQLAEVIKDVETEVKQFVGWPVAPEWIVAEGNRYPRSFLPEGFGLGRNVRGQAKSINAKYGKFMSAGRRAVDLIVTANIGDGSLTYTDEDGDGFYETAVIVANTTVENIHEIKVYFSDVDAQMEWEIRPVRRKTLEAGMLEIHIDSWLLIDPDLYDDFPTGEIQLVDVSTVGSFVGSVDVYREYTSVAEASAEFYWERSDGVGPLFCTMCGGVGCTVCSYITQEGCLIARNPMLGVLTPYPAEYNEEEAVWQSTSFTECKEPDLVKMWYKAGDVCQLYTDYRTYDPLSSQWASAIAAMATARLHRPVCNCARVNEMTDYWRTDIARFTREERNFLTDDVLTSPFGTRRGEVAMWRMCKKLVKGKRLEYALI